METYTNEFHKNHTYIKINDIKKVKVGDLEVLVKDKPLQIGIDSDQLAVIDLLKKAGFILKRKCYEVEVTREDLKNPLGTKKIETKLTSKGEKPYEKASELIFKYYQKTHEDVSPLTVGLEKFKEILPDQAFYYVEEKLADEFINDLLIYLFKHYEEIFFEADTTDPLATRLRDKFVEKADISFDTYIKYK